VSIELGTWLRAQREARGWSRADMARRLIFAAREAGDDAASSPENLRHSIYRWERGRDAGTAIDLAQGISPGAITVTERKATLFIDTARAFMQRGRHENAYLSIRAAHEIAPEEVTGRATVRTLVRDLVAISPPTIRREAAEFAAIIGAAE
jgi:transcriptional regulator with XRE-family HTH domain